LQVFAGVVSIINPPAGSGLAIAAGIIPKLWGDATKAVTAYQSASADKNTKLGEALVALNVLQTQLNQMLIDLGTNPNSTDAQAAKASIALLATTLLTMQQNLAKTPGAPPSPSPPPPLPGAPSSITAVPNTVVVGTTSVAVKAAASPSDLKRQYNQIMQLAGQPDRAIK
jgi:hypothetical protein